MAIIIKERTETTTKGVVKIYRMVNSTGAWVELSSIGAGVTGISVPGRNGDLADIAMGYESVESYTADAPNAGKTCGRYANRIAHGKLTIDGKMYQLDVNCGEHHLHGGYDGFQHRNWDSQIAGDGRVEFTMTSADGDQGYPGKLSVKVVYLWDEDNRLVINYMAETDKATVVNLTNHTYFNLAGHDAGSALNHLLTVDASRYMEADATMRPTGRLLDVKGTPMDFLTPHRLGEHINDDYEALKIGKGYDHCWVIDNETGEIKHVARFVDETSGRCLDISTDQPGVQVYTANWLTGSTPVGKGGAVYRDYDFVAIECQGLPDAPNHASFPSQLLLPGEQYKRTIIYQFSIV